MIKKLFKEDLLKEQHYPILEIMNQIKDDKFLSIIETVSNGIGFGQETGTCLFSDDLDDFSIANGEGFEGVEIALYTGEEDIISHITLYYYLQKSSERYIEKFPEFKNMLLQLLQNYKRKFEIECRN